MNSSISEETSHEVIRILDIIPGLGEEDEDEARAFPEAPAPVVVR